MSFTVRIERADPTPARPFTPVGLDLGLKSLAVLSTGQTSSNPKHLEIAQRELRRLHRQASRRQGPNKHAAIKPSRRWLRTWARIRRLHTKVANARRDGLHKLTTRLVRHFGVIVLEDLNVSGMLTNRRLARHLAGAGLAELRRQITYKAAWADVHVHIADRWYPSSKTCSGCGTVKAKLRLSERVFSCAQCDLVLDRDLNAARNLAALVSSHSWWATENEPDGNPGKTSVVLAAGTAAGRPEPTRPGQRRHRTATAI